MPCCYRWRIVATRSFIFLINPAFVIGGPNEAEIAPVFVLCPAVLFPVIERAVGARGADVADDTRQDCPGCATSSRAALFPGSGSAAGACRGRCAAFPVDRWLWLCADRRKRAAADTHGRCATGCPAEGIVYERGQGD